MSQIKEVRRAAKLGACKAIKKAKAYVLLTYDYEGRLHLEGETTSMVNEMNIYQLTLRTAESYLRNLTLAAVGRQQQTVGAEDQAQRIITAKEDRAKTLASFTENPQ